MNSSMNTFGLKEIRAIRDRWDAMPYEEARAERKELFEKAMTERHGEDWRTRIQVIG